MGPVSYTDAANGALDRLRTTGFYLGGEFFANHGPMAAEALAKLGYCDEVDGWLDANIHHRDYRPLPDPTQPITEWQAALGDRNRGGDWVELFRRELADTPWHEVLQSWWPRLLPGCAGSLTHGLIRTAHAVRSLRESDHQGELQIDELARGLAFWATAFTPLNTAPSRGGDLDAAAVDRALSELTAEYAGHYAATMPPFPIPLIHTITAPAAMRLLLAELPAELHAVAFRTIAEVNRELFARFGGKRAAGSHTSGGPGTDRTFTTLAAEAVDIGDEHAIKICEATMREHAHHPDPRYLGAASAAPADRGRVGLVGIWWPVFGVRCSVIWGYKRLAIACVYLVPKSYWAGFVGFVGRRSAGISGRLSGGFEDLLDRPVVFVEHRSCAKDLPVAVSRSERPRSSPTRSPLSRTRPPGGDSMTIAYVGHFQQRIADAKSDVRLMLGQLRNETLHRVAVGVGGGVVVGGVLPAASNVGSEQHTWWGWLLIGAPLIWLSFLGVVALTFGVLRVVVGVLRWSLSVPAPRSGAKASPASQWIGPQLRHFNGSVNGLARAA